MASSEGTGKNIILLAVVVVCFAVLWPKIFYPMAQSLIFTANNDINSDGRNPLNVQYELLHSHIKEAMGEARPLERRQRDESRHLLHPSSRNSPKPQIKGGGAMNFVMPIYTVGIIVFFSYTVLKLLFKKSTFDEHQALLKGLPISSRFYKYITKEYPLQLPANKKTDKPIQDRKTKKLLEEYGKQKVLSALRTIIAEMEEFKINLVEMEKFKKRLAQLEAERDERQESMHEEKEKFSNYTEKVVKNCSTPL